MPWEPDSSPPIITPERKLAYHQQMLGVEREELALPDVLVATFQLIALEHMVGRIDGGEERRWPTPAFWPMARGSFQGRPLAVTRLPIGAPAASLALELMMAAGVRTALVVGSAGSLQPGLPLGSLVVPDRAIRHEGTSHHYLSADQPSVPSPDLVDALVSTALRRGHPAPAVGATWTTDAPYRECSATVAARRAAGILTVEMEAAALFAVARHRGARAASIVAVSDELREPWSPGFHSLAYRRSLLAAADIALEVAAHLPPHAPGG